MDTLDPSPQAALELEQLWGTPDQKTPWRSETIGPDGQRLLVFEHRSTTPLLIDKPVPARRVGAELAWRVAFDAIALRVKLRRRIAAYLRPIVAGEADDLRRDDLLRCDRRDFPQERDAALDEMMMGRRQYAIIQRGDMLLALLGPLAAIGVEPLSDAAEAEVALLRRLRTSKISRDELRLLLDIWDEQQARNARGISCEEYTPVVRIISRAEDGMLHDLRRTSGLTRGELQGLLKEWNPPRVQVDPARIHQPQTHPQTQLHPQRKNDRGRLPTASRSAVSVASGPTSASNSMRPRRTESGYSSPTRPSSPPKLHRFARPNSTREPAAPSLNREQAIRVEVHTDLVRTIARRVVRQVGTRLLSLEEFESAGYEALVNAAMRYDPTRPTTFAAFAHYRVYGAMIDELRRHTPARRKHERALVRLAAVQKLLSQAAKDQTAREAAEGGDSLEQRVELARQTVRRAALAVCLSEPDTRVTFERIAATEANPEQALRVADERRRLQDLINELEPSERVIIEGIYLLGLCMTDLATELGTSIATISRRHARILDRLAKRALAQERGSVRPVPPVDPNPPKTPK